MWIENLLLSLSPFLTFHMCAGSVFYNSMQTKNFLCSVQDFQSSSSAVGAAGGHVYYSAHRDGGGVGGLLSVRSVDTDWLGDLLQLRYLSFS